MINIDQLKQDLETKIAAADSESTAEELMLLVAALDGLTEDRINSVDTVDDLPTLDFSEQLLGSIFYVKSINTLTFAGTFGWFGLDSRSLRRDYDPLIAYAWGYNNKGQLGDNTTNSSNPNKSSPVTVVGEITNWSQISAGRFHSIGLTDSGVVYFWGHAGSSNTRRSSPVTVIGGITNWSQISAGGYRNHGVANNGIAYTWISESSPVTVVGGITNWSQISTGKRTSNPHNLGVTDDGIAYGWGSNNNGQLGDGNTSFSTQTSPVTVVGGITNWSQVSAGWYHSLGVTDSGIAYAWGNNTDGQLGNFSSGSFSFRSSPTTVVGGISNWSQVSAGPNHSLGVTDSGIVYGWGNNSQGQVGWSYGSFNQTSPRQVVGGITNWSQVYVGGTPYSSQGVHSLGVTDNGIAYAWGSNNNGQLGDGTLTSRSSPVTVVGGITNWVKVSAGEKHSLGIVADPT